MGTDELQRARTSLLERLAWRVIALAGTTVGAGSSGVLLLTTTSLKNGEGIQFGADANQTNHAFRYVDKMGLDRSVVQSAIISDLGKVSSNVTPGKPFNQIL